MPCFPLAIPAPCDITPSMGAQERNLINTRLEGLAPNERLFRANVGVAWAGKAVRKGRFTVIADARPFHGMPEGFPDLVGWTEIEITPDMVGRTIAVFTAEEVKATGRLGKLQRAWRDLIVRMGGVHRIINP